MASHAHSNARVLAPAPTVAQFSSPPYHHFATFAHARPSISAPDELFQFWRRDNGGATMASHPLVAGGGEEWKEELKSNAADFHRVFEIRAAEAAAAAAADAGSPPDEASRGIGSAVEAGAAAGRPCSSGGTRRSGESLEADGEGGGAGMARGEGFGQGGYEEMDRGGGGGEVQMEESPLGGAATPGSMAWAAAKRVRKVNRRARFGQHTLGRGGEWDSVDATPMATGSPTNSVPTPGTGCRFDNSLGLLTRKFIDLIKSSEDGVLDLNGAAHTLKVQKRRIYDITNVLEGIGLIEKKSKNNIQWKSMETPTSAAVRDEGLALEAELEASRQHEAMLDSLISDTRERLATTSTSERHKPFLYVTEEDIKTLPSFQNQTLIAIKAPAGTMLEVPDPDEGGLEYPHKRFQVNFKSEGGPIDVYLVSRFEERFEGLQQQDRPAAGAESTSHTLLPGPAYSEATSAITSVPPEPPVTTTLSAPFSPPPFLLPGISSPPPMHPVYLSNDMGAEAPLLHHPHAQHYAGGAAANLDDFMNGREVDENYWLLSDTQVPVADLWQSDDSDPPLWAEESLQAAGPDALIALEGGGAASAAEAAPLLSEGATSGNTEVKEELPGTPPPPSSVKTGLPEALHQSNPPLEGAPLPC
eukprot:TRINITY_DN11177_c0_g1_i1.p1 TRINITY_DN11177_c0_g1~~TRINITY_DN11177_c0_g1_i1.p1  ORF type:complete len:643 (-),score=164.30 TRINITY_DN11177_c0_g1_i1:1071-2999(-)